MDVICVNPGKWKMYELKIKTWYELFYGLAQLVGSGNDTNLQPILVS